MAQSIFLAGRDWHFANALLNTAILDNFCVIISASCCAKHLAHSDGHERYRSSSSTKKRLHVLINPGSDLLRTRFEYVFTDVCLSVF